jgi:hypothetical protein
MQASVKHGDLGDPRLREREYVKQPRRRQSFEDYDRDGGINGWKAKQKKIEESQTDR